MICAYAPAELDFITKLFLPFSSLLPNPCLTSFTWLIDGNSGEVWRLPNTHYTLNEVSKRSLKMQFWGEVLRAQHWFGCLSQGMKEFECRSFAFRCLSLLFTRVGISLPVSPTCALFCESAVLLATRIYVCCVSWKCKTFCALISTNSAMMICAIPRMFLSTNSSRCAIIALWANLISAAVIT